MNRTKTRIGLAALAMVVVLSAGCAAAQPSAQAPGSDQGRLAEASKPAVAPPAPAAPIAQVARGGAPNDQGAAASQLPALTDQRLIVRTATLTLLVPDVPGASAKAQALAQTLGGFVVNATQREESGRPAGTVQIRVPAERLDEAMGQLRGLADRVQSEQVQSQDVTEEFVDTDARLRNLKATEQRYLDLLAQAKSVEDILKVEQQLSTIRGQIEQLQARVNFLQRSAQLSSITVELRLPAAAQSPAPSDWAVQPIFRNAVAALLTTLQFLLGLLIFVAVFSPIWLPLVFLIRWLRRRRQARRVAVPAAPSPAPASPAV